MPRRITIAGLTLLLMMLMVSPALAQVNLSVNGTAITPATAPLLDNGVTKVDANTIEWLTGADVINDGDTTTFIKNSTTLTLKVGDINAKLNDENVELPVTPVVQNGNNLFPLRFVVESLGAQVGWDQPSKTVTISYIEKRNGMTAEELLIASSQKMQQHSSYKMTGSMDMAMKIKEPANTEVPLETNMKSDFEAFYSVEPLKVYTIQKINMADVKDIPPELENVTVESLLIDNVYYSTIPGQGWVKMDMAGFDLNKLMEQYNSQDPAIMLKNMRDFGIMTTFGNDKQIEDRDYWSVKTTMDKDKYMAQFKDIMNQMQVLPEGTASLLDGIDFELSYTSYIDQQTLESTLMDMYGTIKMNLDVPAAENQEAQSVNMDMTMNGKFKISDYDLEFSTPDVSSAKNLTEMVPEFPENE